jgi:hypothetical protein
MYYRFNNGSYIEADNYTEAQEKLIKRISEEKENKKRWHRCTCVGLSHSFNCPEAPHNSRLDTSS